jgi:hypothetical protein
MKSPHKQRPDDQARADTEKFIAAYKARPGAKSGRSARPLGAGGAGRSSKSAGRARAAKAPAVK